MFYNMTTRKKSVTNVNEEYRQILDVMQKYAIHNPRVSFRCKNQQKASKTKAGAVSWDVRSQGGKYWTTRDAAAELYGPLLEQNLLELEFQRPELHKLRVKIATSGPNYSNRKQVFILFINNRLVENSTLKALVSSMYSGLLQKGCYPWTYMALEINPESVDVNVKDPIDYSPKFFF